MIYRLPIILKTRTLTLYITLTEAYLSSFGSIPETEAIYLM